MSLLSAFLIFGILAVSASGLALQCVFKVPISMGNHVVPTGAVVLGIALSFLFLRDFDEAILFLAAALSQFFSFVFVSRMRQRGSYALHAVSAVAANGTWFFTVHILDMGGAYWLLAIPFLAGLLAGRVVGVLWAQFLEARYELTADVTRDPRPAPGERLSYVLREPMFWSLSVGLIAYIIYGVLAFESSVFSAMFVVVALGVFQNLMYAMNTRALNRGGNIYIAVTGVASYAIFFASTAFLFSKDVPLELFTPYVLSAALGSTIGAFFSMLIESRHSLSPDAHLKKKAGERSSPESVVWYKNRKNIPLAVMAALAVGWMFLSEAILTAFGIRPSPLSLPFPVPTGVELPREAVMFVAALLFLSNNALHTVFSRAGNRNHAGYHVVVTVFKGVADFLMLSYIALNADIPDILPIAVFSGCLGSLFGKNISEYIETRLGAVMDVPMPKPVPKA